MNINLSQLPKDLPAPVDDGAASHLESLLIPETMLNSTDGAIVNLAELPGARGCTPQSCSFRDHYAELKTLRTGVFGLSVQTTDYQREARDRLRLPVILP